MPRLIYQCQKLPAYKDMCAANLGGIWFEPKITD